MANNAKSAASLEVVLEDNMHDYEYDMSGKGGGVDRYEQDFTTLPITPSKPPLPERPRQQEDNDDLVRRIGDMFNTRFDSLEAKCGSLISANTELLIEGLRQTINSTTAQVTDLTKIVNELQVRLAAAEERANAADQRSIDNENYSRRRNLRLLLGLRETKDQDVRKDVIKIRQSVRPEHEARFPGVADTVHRLGQPISDESKPRTVIMQFTSRVRRDAVSPYGQSNKLRFAEHLSKAKRDRRKLLRPQVERARKAGKKAGFSGGRAFVNAPATQLPQQETNTVSPVLLHCTEQFKRDLLQREAGSIYVPKPKGQRSRLALLINNFQFHDLPMRRGSEKDEENMEKLLKDLDYSVVKHSNLSAEDINKIVREFSQRAEHWESDSTFVVIMSHGKRDFICGMHHDSDDPEKKDLFSIDNIFKHLNNQNCPALADKPKVIVIQACRGNEQGYEYVNDNVTNSLGLEDDGIMKQLKEKDFICLMSCTPDTKSYRDIATGGFFIQKLVETINTYAHKDHIEELSRKVRKHFEECKMQMPSGDRLTLTNNFYLFPGL